METQWEAELVELLTELSTVQGEILDVLREKRAALATANLAEINAFQEREQQLLERLQHCHTRRTELLNQAASGGRRVQSLGALASSLPRPARTSLERQIAETSSRARLLRHQSLTNWVVVQRSLLHISHLLEIVATGGRPQPTYGKGVRADGSGALVDRAA